MVNVVRRYEITDAEWEQLKQYFPDRQAGERGRPRKDSRQMLNGIVWIARSGAAWRDLPERYGPWQTVYKRFVQWQTSGLLERIFHDLSTDADLQEISIASTCIKAHKASAGDQRGGECCPKSAKKPVYRNQPWRSQYEDSCDRRCIGQSGPCAAICRERT